MRRAEALSAIVLVLASAASIGIYRGRAEAVSPPSLAERIPSDFVDWTASPRVFNPIAYGLGADADYIAREYVSPLLGSIDFVGVTDNSLGSLADPGLNLKTQGWLPYKTTTVHLGPPGHLGAEVFLSRVRKGATRICLAYWFVSEGRGTPSVASAQFGSYWSAFVSDRMRGPVSVFRVAATIVTDEDETENAVRTFIDELLNEMASSTSRR
jgi:hypothetical protein